MRAISQMATPDGIEFAMLGERPRKPAPTVFSLALSGAESLGNEPYGRTAWALVEHGWLAVSLDLPCHGADAQPGQTNALAGWRARIERGEDILTPFLARAGAVLDYLAAAGYTDPDRVATCGTSRGGFAAMHFAAADSRVRCVAGFAPLTDLLALSEFDGMRGDELVESMALLRSVDRLAGRPLWICIGDRDARVGTELAVELALRITRSAEERGLPEPVELHVIRGLSHGNGHSVPVECYEQAAGWILRSVK